MSLNSRSGSEVVPRQSTSIGVVPEVAPAKLNETNLNRTQLKDQKHDKYVQ